MLLALTLTLQSTKEKDQKQSCDKRDDFTFSIVYYPFISSNIPVTPAYAVYISQLVRYSKACAQYSNVLDRVQLLMQDYVVCISLSVNSVLYFKLIWIY
jgi:hypothetical protein